MKLRKVIVVGFCLFLSLGLVLVNMGICQQAQPAPATGQAAPAETKKPEAAPKAKEATPAKDSKAQGKPGGAGAAPAVPQTSADPGKLPGKFVPSEGC